MIKENIKINPISAELVQSIKEYLKNCTEFEEGGLLLGSRIWNEDKSSLTVQVDKFVKIKSNFKAHGLSKEDLKARILPGEEIGYYPDPEEYLKVVEGTKSMNPSSEVMIVGFVHNHPHWEAFPSRYDLTHVTRDLGYVMAIYSNLRDHVRFWYVIENKDETKWSKNSSSLAAVELAVTL